MAWARPPRAPRVSSGAAAPPASYDPVGAVARIWAGREGDAELATLPTGGRRRSRSLSQPPAAAKEALGPSKEVGRSASKERRPPSACSAGTATAAASGDEKIRRTSSGGALDDDADSGLLSELRELLSQRNRELEERCQRIKQLEFALQSQEEGSACASQSEAAVAPQLVEESRQTETLLEKQLEERLQDERIKWERRQEELLNESEKLESHFKAQIDKQLQDILNGHDETQKIRNELVAESGLRAKHEEHCTQEIARLEHRFNIEFAHREELYGRELEEAKIEMLKEQDQRIDDSLVALREEFEHDIERLENDERQRRRELTEQNIESQHTLREELIDREQRLQEHAEKASALSAEEAKARAQLEHDKANASAQEALLEEMLLKERQQSEALSSNLQQLDQRLQLQIGQLNEAEIEAGKERALREEVNSKLAELECTSQRDLESKAARAATIERELAAEKNELEKLRSELEDSNKRFDEGVASKEAREDTARRELKEENDILQAFKSEWSASEQHLRKELAQEEAQCKASRDLGSEAARAATVERELSAKKNELEKLRSELEDSNKRIDESVASKEACEDTARRELREENDIVQKLKSEWSASERRLRKALAEEEAQCEASRNEAEEEKVHNSMLRSKQAILLSELEGYRAGNTSHASDKDVDRSSSPSNSQQNTRREHVGSAKEVRQLRTECQELEYNLQEARKEASLLRDECREMSDAPVASTANQSAGERKGASNVESVQGDGRTRIILSDCGKGVYDGQAEEMHRLLAAAHQENVDLRERIRKQQEEIEILEEKVLETLTGLRDPSDRGSVARPSGGAIRSSSLPSRRDSGTPPRQHPGEIRRVPQQKTRRGAAQQQANCWTTSAG